MMKMLTAGLAICLLSSSVYAGEWSQSGYTSDYRVFSSSNGSVVFASLSSLDSTYNQQICGNSNNAGQFSFYIFEDVTSKGLMSILLSAELANRQVQVYLTGNCTQNRPEINGARIVG